MIACGTEQTLQGQHQQLNLHRAYLLLVHQRCAGGRKPAAGCLPAIPHPLTLRTCIWSTSSMQAVEEPRMPSSRRRLAANCNAKRGRQEYYNQELAVHSQPCSRHNTAGARPTAQAVAPDAGTRPGERAVGCEQCAPTCSTRSTSVVPRSTECRANSIMRRLQEQSAAQAWGSLGSCQTRQAWLVNVVTCKLREVPDRKDGALCAAAAWGCHKTAVTQPSDTAAAR